MRCRRRQSGIADASGHSRASAGGFIIILGLHVSGLITLPLLGREARLLGVPHRAHRASSASLFAAFFMGAAFAFGWTPCIGPILATILALAAAREVLAKGWPLTFYAAGLGLPFLLAALGVSRFLLVSAAVKKYMMVERSAGVVCRHGGPHHAGHAAKPCHLSARLVSGAGQLPARVLR